MGLTAASGLIGLAALFFLTAMLYASVGFGGGSTYIALLALADTDYRLLPIIALLCNIIVVSGGTWRFHRHGLVPWKRITPILLMSVPAAWLGGRIPIEQASFLILLGLSLVTAGLLLFAEPLLPVRGTDAKQNRSFSAPLLGTGIGFLSGMVGIGGGIFLAPILLLMRWADSRRVAATASIFILVNSIAGLAGQLMKWRTPNDLSPLTGYVPLFAAVLIGGQIGSLLASRTLPEVWIKRLTALLILYVAGRILWQQF